MACETAARRAAARLFQEVFTKGMVRTDKEPIVRLSGVTKDFGKSEVLKNIDLDVYEGEFLTLLGPSGCGKTTTLRMIAGFEYPTSGQIFLEGELFFAGQRPAVNVGLSVSRVEKMLELVQLKNFGRRKPHQMSGGQRQRVAIARALVNNPKVLLLDEPLGALDLKLRKQMQMELKHLQRQLGITFIYVTHDQEEALTMSDRIAVMNGGVIEQIGTAQEIYEHPKTKFVAGFIGESNIIEASVTGINGDLIELTAENGVVHARGTGFVQDEMIYISIRPENTMYSFEPVENFRLRGIVKEHIYVGSIVKTVVALPNGQRLKLNKHPHSDLPDVGAAVTIYWDMDKAVIMHTAEDTLYDLIEDALLGRPDLAVQQGKRTSD